MSLSEGVVCALSFGDNVLLKIILNKCIMYKIQYEKGQQTSKPFDKLYGKKYKRT